MTTCSQFLGVLGLAEFKRKRELAEKAELEAKAYRPALPPAKPAEPPRKPPQPPRWRFAAIPDEAITRRTKGSVRIELSGELEGWQAWVREWRIKAHAEHGHVLTLKLGSTLLAEKREKRAKGWKTVATKSLDRKAVLAMFREVRTCWDELSDEHEPNDDPDWMTDGRYYVKEYTPPPLEKEDREIASELLMGSDEESWKELEEGN